MILMDRIGAPDVSLEVYSFLNFRFHMFFKFKDLSGLNKGLSLFYVKKKQFVTFQHEKRMNFYFFIRKSNNFSLFVITSPCQKQ